MARINILPPLVADMIAAGEVVERPASAVKELLENALDAGAGNITVELRAGGAEYLRVADDGCGMAPEDAGVAFVRHATSKLSDARGLEAIGTMGFRGEALAAIGAVSHVELTTRERGAASGVRLTLSGGDIEDMRECGCPEGTVITVRGLFYNTPARLKFMKSDRAEGTACVQAALRCALGRPEASVRCLRDGEEQFFTPGDGRMESAVYCLLGREIAGDMLPIASDDGAVAASGFISSPRGGRGSRAMQYFFVNGRSVKSQLLQAAVEQAYRNTLLTGKYPACCVYVSLSPGAVDVNVHPAKAEVKFSDEKRVFDAVYYAALWALEKRSAPGQAGDAGLRRPEDAVSRVPMAARQSPVPPRREAEGRSAVAEPGVGYYQSRMALGGVPPLRAPLEAPAPPAEPPAPSPAPAPEEPASAPDAPVRVLGEALGLYILAEKGDALIFIDKHAAHERILFDKLKERGSSVMSQSLLLPEPVGLSDALEEVLEDNAQLLGDLGYEWDGYGGGSCLLRAVPDGLDPAEAASALEEILDGLKKNRRMDKNGARDAALRTVACKAAVKAGRSSDPAELLALAEEVLSGAVRYCPHGRPVSWTLTREDLDRMFKRIV